MTVLVVDDDEHILQLAARLFRQLPVRLRCVRNATDALGQVEEEPPDLLISDFHMPDIDGLVLLERVRARWPQVRMVLYTSDGGALQKAEALGIAAVPKLDARQAFPALVAEALKQKRQ